MKLSMLTASAGLIALAMMTPARATMTGPYDQTARLQPVAYDEVPTSGARHRGRKRGPIAKSPDPSVPDLHGATREDADQQYRKKYGF